MRLGMIGAVSCRGDNGKEQWRLQRLGAYVSIDVQLVLAEQEARRDGGADAHRAGGIRQGGLVGGGVADLSTATFAA